MSNKYWPWLLIAGLCVIGTSYCISARNISKIAGEDLESENPSPFNELLSENFRTTILSAESVQWITDSIINNSISEVLTSPVSFQQDSVTKESTFMPDFGVMFITPSDTVLVSYSLYCDICRFQRNDELIDLNG